MECKIEFFFNFSVDGDRVEVTASVLIARRDALDAVNGSALGAISRKPWVDQGQLAAFEVSHIAGGHGHAA